MAMKAGWYQNPNDDNDIRYWDGNQWTGETRTAAEHAAAKSGLLPSPLASPPPSPSRAPAAPSDSTGTPSFAPLPGFSPLPGTPATPPAAPARSVPASAAQPPGARPVASRSAALRSRRGPVIILAVIAVVLVGGAALAAGGHHTRRSTRSRTTVTIPRATPSTTPETLATTAPQPTGTTVKPSAVSAALISWEKRVSPELDTLRTQIDAVEHTIPAHLSTVSESVYPAAAEACSQISATVAAIQHDGPLPNAVYQAVVTSDLKLISLGIADCLQGTAAHNFYDIEYGDAELLDGNNTLVEFYNALP